MDNWLQSENVGDASDLSPELLVQHLQTVYLSSQYQLAIVEFEIDGKDYVIMTKQDFVDWHGR